MRALNGVVVLWPYVRTESHQVEDGVQTITKEDGTTQTTTLYSTVKLGSRA